RHRQRLLPRLHPTRRCPHRAAPLNQPQRFRQRHFIATIEYTLYAAWPAQAGALHARLPSAVHTEAEPGSAKFRVAPVASSRTITWSSAMSWKWRLANTSCKTSGPVLPPQLGCDADQLGVQFQPHRDVEVR